MVLSSALVGIQCEWISYTKHIWTASNGMRTTVYLLVQIDRGLAGIFGGSDVVSSSTNSNILHLEALERSLNGESLLRRRRNSGSCEDYVTVMVRKRVAIDIEKASDSTKAHILHWQEK